MSLSKCFDAAFPPSNPPKGFQAALGYIGGHALHVWTPAQWAPFAHLRQFPCWVADTGSSGARQGRDASAAAVKLGWNPHMSHRPRALVGDMETAQDPTWWDEFAKAVRPFVAVCYGSLSVVGGNLASHVWAADWDNEAVLPADQTIVACQYRAEVSFDNTKLDYSVLNEWLLTRGGLGKRAG